MTRPSRSLVVAALVTATACVAVQAAPIGSASRLTVDAGFAQSWLLPGPDAPAGSPEPPDPAPPGTEVDLSACGDLDEYDEVVYGTEGVDELRGGNRPQILVGLGGDDVLRGGNQHDCLLGGPGDDHLEGGNGKDVLIGGAGTDTLDGGNGKDLLYGDDGVLECSAPEGDVLVDECEPVESEKTPGRTAKDEPERAGQATQQSEGQATEPQPPQATNGSDDTAESGAEPATPKSPKSSTSQPSAPDGEQADAGSEADEREAPSAEPSPSAGAGS